MLGSASLLRPAGTGTVAEAADKYAEIQPENMIVGEVPSLSICEILTHNAPNVSSVSTEFVECFETGVHPE